MAHKLDFSKGRAAFVAYQKPGWHGLGKVSQDILTAEQALDDSGQDFHVEKLPNVHRLPDGSEVVSDNSFFTYREDTLKVLGDKLGKDYTVLQNKDAFAIVNDILGTGKCQIETAGAIDEGRRVFITLKLNEPIKVGGSDVISQYILICNSHDGTLAITLLPTNIRVVCNNTLSAALAGGQASHKIRHTANAQDRVREAFTIMNILDRNASHSTAAYEAMKATSLTKQEFFDYIGNVFMNDEEIKALQAGNRDAISTRKKNIITGVLDFSETGPGQKEALGNNLNGWYAYNAITGYLTGKRYSSADDRFNSMYFGDTAAKIKSAGELALKPQYIQPLKATANAIILN